MSRPSTAPGRSLRTNNQYKQMREYNATKLDQLVTKMMSAVFLAQPKDPAQFMMQWLSAQSCEAGAESGEKEQMLRTLLSIAPTLDLCKLTELVSIAEGATTPSLSTAPDEMPSGADVDAAATKIQAVHRGKLDRKDIADQQEAAVKIQVVQRGKQDRKAMAGM
eukprot:COSAG05_NODE_9096_length_648_cov_0.504554_1_plen_163_part_10